MKKNKSGLNRRIKERQQEKRLREREKVLQRGRKKIKRFKKPDHTIKSGQIKSGKK